MACSETGSEQVHIFFVVVASVRAQQRTAPHHDESFVCLRGHSLARAKHESLRVCAQRGEALFRECAKECALTQIEAENVST